MSPSPCRRGLDWLLARYPDFDVVTVEAPSDDPPSPWLLVQLGERGETTAYALWRFAIWRTTGAVHRIAHGAVDDDPIYEPS